MNETNRVRYSYRLFQGFRRNFGKRSKMIAFGLISITFEVFHNFEASGEVAKIDLSLKLNCFDFRLKPICVTALLPQKHYSLQQ